MFLCKSTGDYVNVNYLCDTENDCKNGEDEIDCEFNRQHFFQCVSDGKLISIQFVCNHVNDCSDTSDEIHCGKHKNIKLFINNIFFP